MRLLPYCYTAARIRRISEDESTPACLYFHTWELDVAPAHIRRTTEHGIQAGAFSQRFHVWKRVQPPSNGA